MSHSTPHWVASSFSHFSNLLSPIFLPRVADPPTKRAGTQGKQSVDFFEECVKLREVTQLGDQTCSLSGIYTIPNLDRTMTEKIGSLILLTNAYYKLTSIPKCTSFFAFQYFWDWGASGNEHTGFHILIYKINSKQSFVRPSPESCIFGKDHMTFPPA